MSSDDTNGHESLSKDVDCTSITEKTNPEKASKEDILVCGGQKAEESAVAGASKKAESSGSARKPWNTDIELITKYLAEKLGFSSKEVHEAKPPQPKPCPAVLLLLLHGALFPFISDGHPISEILDDVSLDGIVSHIKKGHCKKIITLAGAGISTSAGIPDFRSPGSGIYHNLQKYNLPDPQAIFDIQFFRSNPQPFFTLAKELYPGSFKPTVCHYFIRLLHEKGLLLRHYTQNIDTLERVAEIPSEKLVEAHGTFYTSHCLDCAEEYSLEWMKDHIFSDSIPTCSKCNGVVKPDIVFFGENLPQVYFDRSTKDFPKCDLLIAMGSSLAVQPFASLIDGVSSNCPRLLLNREKAGQRDRLMQLFGMSSGMDFDSPDNSRDVFWLGTCDDGCQLLADKLGWGEELKQLVRESHAEIDKRIAQDKAEEKVPQSTEAASEH